MASSQDASGLSDRAAGASGDGGAAKPPLHYAQVPVEERDARHRTAFAQVGPHRRHHAGRRAAPRSALIACHYFASWVAELVETPSADDHFDIWCSLLVSLALFGSIALLLKMQIVAQLG